MRITNLRVAFIAAWLGLAIYFSAVVAPSAFAVLRSFNLANAGEIAGTIVSRALSVVNKSGLLLSLLLLVSAPAVKKVLWSLVVHFPERSPHCRRNSDRGWRMGDCREDARSARDDERPNRSSATYRSKPHGVCSAACLFCRSLEYCYDFRIDCYLAYDYVS